MLKCGSYSWGIVIILFGCGFIMGEGKDRQAMFHINFEKHKSEWNFGILTLLGQSKQADTVEARETNCDHVITNLLCLADLNLQLRRNLADWCKYSFC